MFSLVSPLLSYKMVRRSCACFRTTADVSYAPESNISCLLFFPTSFKQDQLVTPLAGFISTQKIKSGQNLHLKMHGLVNMADPDAAVE